LLSQDEFWSERIPRSLLLEMLLEMRANTMLF